MTRRQRFLLPLAVFISLASFAHAQVGVGNAPAHSLLSCMVSSAGVPLLRPEGYTELLGDILVTCTGGPTFQAGASIPTTNVTVYITPSVPITSRTLGPGANSNTFASEALLIIDEAGSGLLTGATGGYGPQAPQSLCTSAQQQQYPAAPCAGQVGLDNSGQYEVAVVPGTSTPAQNIYQGDVGDFGVNSVTFYNVPVLPPAYLGVARTFRITNLRIPTVGYNPSAIFQAVVSTSPNQVFPVPSTAINVGLVGNPMHATVSASSGGGNRVVSCLPQTSPTLATQLTFTEGFATSFRTRVAPGGAAIANTTWAAEAQNLVSPANQNIPGGLYGGFNTNTESGFILPAAFTDTGSNLAYTAGLADFGTRLKAVFTNIPSGITVYVSTANSAAPAVPGGTSIAPYAVLVSASQYGQGNNDGAVFLPLVSTTVGSDGLFAYPLTADNLGVTAAVWEVVNSNPQAIDTLTFSTYMACGTGGNFALPTLTLSYAPQSGAGSFSSFNGTYGLDNPMPRFQLPGDLCIYCVISAPISASFSYPSGAAQPPDQYFPVTVSPSNLIVSAAPNVTTPTGGNWLYAGLNNANLDIEVNPTGLAVSSTPYVGNVKLSAYGVTDVLVPVSLTVYPPLALGIAVSHSGNFVQGEQGATYSIAVGNGASAGPTNGLLTVTENPPSGESIVSMTGDSSVWSCIPPLCSTSRVLAGGNSYPPITVSVIVASNASSQLTNMATVSGGGSETGANAIDLTTIVPFTCTFTGAPTPTAADVQMIVNEALGVYPAAFDLNGDGVVNIADIQVIVKSTLSSSCVQ